MLDPGHLVPPYGRPWCFSAAGYERRRYPCIGRGWSPAATRHIPARTKKARVPPPELISEEGVHAVPPGSPTNRLSHRRAGLAGAGASRVPERREALAA